MELVVVYNPTAGAGDWTEGQLEELLRAAGYSPQMVSSKTNWRAHLAAQPAAIVAAGGDGTVHKVILAAAGSTVPVAILPLGTANNVATALGYRSGDDLALRVAGWRDHEQVLQLAAAQSDSRQELFVEAVGLGAFADMMHATESNGVKNPPPIALLNIRKRLVELLMEARPMKVSAKLDGTALSGEYLLLECLNLPWYGPRLGLAPDESADSPTVTLCGVPVAAREQAMQWISTGEGDVRQLILGRGRCVEFSANGAPAHIDGDPWPESGSGGTHLRVRGGVQSVRVWV